MNLFIASLSEGLRLARALKTSLSSHGYNVSVWSSAFKPGDITIIKLIELANEVDGGIFLFSRDDTVRSRGRTFFSPRDNVLLEFGIFVSRFGLKRTMVIKVDGNATHQLKIPSDLQGLTYHQHKKTRETIEVIKDVFRPSNQIEKSNCHLLKIDPDVVPYHLGTTAPPANWLQRCLYIGTEGFKHWKEVVEDPNYFGHRMKGEMAGQIHAAIEGVETDVFISFGPGYGTLDRSIATSLGKEKKVKYIPVDISEEMLVNSFNELRQVADVPFGIMTDFEEGFPFLQEYLREVRGRKLFSMLGNTLGNLDQTERDFLNNIRGIMSPDDLLMLEVSTTSGQKSVDNAQSPKSQALRKFYAYGLSAKTKEKIEDIVMKYDTRIKRVSEASGFEPATAFKIFDNKTSHVIIKVRRYYWRKFLDWL